MADENAGDDAPQPDVPAADGRDHDAAPHAAGRVVAGGVLLVLVIVISFLVFGNQQPPATTQAVAAPPPMSQTTTSTTEAPAPTTTTTAAPAEVGTTTTTRKPRRAPTGPPGPLTGAPVDVAGYERRPALILKIDNAEPFARPQAGLTLADIVYEEKVEGPISRFAAVFQGSDAEQIGPIRSARSTDVQIAGSFTRPLFGYSGSNGGFARLLSIAPLINVGADHRGGAYWRGGDKPMPHNLYTSTASLYAGVSGFVPPPQWPFRAPSEPAGAGAQPASAVSYHFGGQVTAVRWTWDPADKVWTRSQNGSIHYDMDNWPVTASNVVIQYVEYAGSAIAEDMFGNSIPEALLGGVGTGFVMTGGAAVPMTWSRFGIEEQTRYADANDQPIRFAPGKTWIILVPKNLPASIG